MTRTLVDDSGAQYRVPEEVLHAPHNGGPTRRLHDPQTGDTYDLPAEMFDEGGTAPQGAPPLPGRTPGFQEKVIEVCVENNTLGARDRERTPFLAGAHLAVGKIASPNEHRIAELEVENLARSLSISPELYEEDQLIAFARSQIRRACTYDRSPNEREWITTQSIHQKTEQRAEQPGGGILSGIGRAFGKGRRY